LAPRRTLIRAGYVIAYDGRAHRLLRDGVVVLEGDRIVHVGPRFDGTADETIDARDRIVTPGLISTHAHISGSPLDKSFIEDRGNPQFWFSGLFEMLPVRSGAQDEDAGRACIDFSMGELLRSGCTTVMEIGGQGEDVVEAVGRFGMRVYMGQAFRSGRWVTYDGKRVVWELDEAAGQAGLQRAVEFFKKHDGAHGDLVFVALDDLVVHLLDDGQRRKEHALLLDESARGLLSMIHATDELGGKLGKLRR
jgi:cytosine/adenosine deaminase-related metal-dependent hydrolase